MISSFKKVPRGLLLFLALVLLDQASKQAELFIDIKNIGFIKIQASVNSGLAFSITGSNTLGILFSIFWLALALYLLYRFKSEIARLGILLMIAGGASNLLDRVVWGGVRDIFTIRNGLFNLADVVILSGAIVVIWGSFYLKQPTQQPLE